MVACEDCGKELIKYVDMSSENKWYHEIWVCPVCLKVCIKASLLVEASPEAV